MTIDETPGRSVARAHLSQLIVLFGPDGCLRISTAPASDPRDAGLKGGPGVSEPDNDQ
ncbi:hypothetical protein [Streptomyces sp. NPDC048410]|uniref:hypothetical protein n=1 Tax=Streptomyces sp. NPDC048410 TaxID=3365545 RepID=UPI0037177D70